MEVVFSVTKVALFPYVDAVFGWDDNFQRARLANDYDLNWYFWIYQGRERVGLVCYKHVTTRLHLHLLIIFLEFQGRGIGAQVMDLLKQEAIDASREMMTLSSFIANSEAIRFYTDLGYVIEESDKDFYHLTLVIEDA